MEPRDLPHKINEAVRENVKEVVQIALQAPLRDRFRDLPEEDMKEMLHQRMFESEDTGFAHLPHVKPRLAWLKPIPEDDRPAAVEPAWVIPTSYIPDTENNWANTLATTYQAPAENLLLEKTRDMRTFMNWYCQKMGKTKLTQADIEGQAYEVVKAFYLDVV
ncbi:hypothetical protein Tco_1436669, partial [Tanacetum coccineum]